MNHRSLAQTAIALAGLMRTFAAPGSAAETKDYTLFVGSDFSVARGGEFHAVTDAGNRTFVLQNGGRRTEIPLREIKDIRISRGLKLSNVTATIGKVDATLSSDAAVAEEGQAIFASMALQTMNSQAADRALGKMLNADLGRGADGSVLNPAALAVADGERHQFDATTAYPTTLNDVQRNSGALRDMAFRANSARSNEGDEIQITPVLSNDAAGLNVARLAPSSPSADPAHPAAPGKVSSPAATPGSPIARTVRVRDTGNGRSDRFDLTFEVSSPSVLDNTYLVLVTEYTTDKYPGQVFRRVLTSAVGHVDAKPRKVSLYQTFFPAGFALRTFTLDLYAEGQEVATNLSDTKAALTRDEAYQYLVADYLAVNHGKTLPPAAMLMVPRSQLERLTSTADARQPVYVSVDVDGNAVHVSLNPHTVVQPPASITDALREFRFVPALDHGVPVAGRAKLILADFDR